MNLFRQLTLPAFYAAAGYVVLYTNSRGSTGYGEEFAQLINGSYPGNEYDALMTGVDAVLARSYVYNNNLFVTGGAPCRAAYGPKAPAECSACAHLEALARLV
jgi:hypothetical protein